MSESQTFYIVKHGVYLQGVYGPYDTKESAMRAFDEAYNLSLGGPYTPFDGHHDYYIVTALGGIVGDSIDLEFAEKINYVSKKP